MKWKKWKRWLLALIALLIIGIAVLFIFTNIHVLVFPFVRWVARVVFVEWFPVLFGFLKGFFIRFGGRKILVPILVGLLPFALRHKSRRIARTIFLLSKKYVRRSIRRFRRLPLWKKIFIMVPIVGTMLGLMFIVGGVFELFTAVLPVRVPTFLVEIVKGRLIPILGRFAFGQWLLAFAPKLMRLIPRPVKRGYKKFKIRALRILVGTRRKTAEKKEEILERLKNHIVPSA